MISFNTINKILIYFSILFFIFKEFFFKNKYFGSEGIKKLDIINMFLKFSLSHELVILNFTLDIFLY